MRPLLAALAAALAATAIPACADERPAPEPRDASASARATSALRYVGSSRCAACHPAETARWRSSHHDLAMQAPTPTAVLGDFADASFTHFGRTTRFRREGDRHLVETEGPGGERRTYEVAWTFGVEPLQQVLLRLSRGRVQAFDVAWDSRPAEAGGRRWFSLHPGPVPPGDVLHWTQPPQRWNTQCAECHSTGVRRGYDEREDSYETTFAELDVACEACHGPGSRHAAWAEDGAEVAAGAAAGLAVDLSGDGGRWRFAPGAAIARRTPPRAERTEIEVCAPCHARRSALSEAPEPGAPLLDGYRPALLDADLYHADGQILDEVYVWGSFAQSRMYAAGVSCGDCHDPHALTVADPPEATCGRCHLPEAFATPAHHHHPAGSAGASCLACHMPARTYMQIDARRDHSFRVPRPDLSVEIGTPNACEDCHAGRPPAWAAAAAARWWGAGRAEPVHYGEILHAGRRRAAGAGARLVALAGDPGTPGIVRASALLLLRENPDPALPAALGAALRDPDPLVRMAAAEASEVLPPRSRLRAVAPLLRDPRLAVRLAAGLALADTPAQRLDRATQGALAGALAAYRAAQRVHADRPEAQVNLGALYARTGEPAKARAAYRRALALAPWFVPARVNLADLEREAGREAAAEALLRGALEHAPAEASVHHALGLALVRQQRLDEALGFLARAAALEPERARYAMVHGLALHAAGASQRALETLAAARARHPADPELLFALATTGRDIGALDTAREAARALAALRPGDPVARRLLAELDAAAPGGSPPDASGPDP